MIMRMFIQVPEMFIVKRTPCQNRASCRGFNGRTLTFLIGCLLKNILILYVSFSDNKRWKIGIHLRSSETKTAFTCRCVIN